MNCKQEVQIKGFQFPRYKKCSRKAMKDGFCNMHHPDTKKATEKRQEEKYKKESQKRRLEHNAAKFLKVLKEISKMSGCVYARAIADEAIEEYENDI